jgi:hypothetical protein
MNSEIVFEAKKQRVIRAIEKYGRLSNRELSRKCSVYGDNFTRALREIDNPQDVMKRPPTAKELAAIAEKYLIEKFMPTISRCFDRAKELANEGKREAMFDLRECTAEEISTLVGFAMKQGFIVEHLNDKEVRLQW